MQTNVRYSRHNKLFIFGQINELLQSPEFSFNNRRDSICPFSQNCEDQMRQSLCKFVKSTLQIILDILGEF